MAERLTREQSRHRTRTAILDAAEDAFTSRGYRAASLEEIALAAGFTKGAVYSSFTSKADLFLALLDRRADRDRSEMTSVSPVAVNDPSWSLATLDFLIDSTGDPRTRRALAERYEQARSQAGDQLATAGPQPTWATWTEIASVAMALGSGLIIQSIIDPDAVPEDLFGRTMTVLLDAGCSRIGTPGAAQALDHHDAGLADASDSGDERPSTGRSP